MMLSGGLRVPVLGLVRRVAFSGLLLTLVLMLSCGGGGDVGQTSGSGGDASVVSNSIPQSGSGEDTSSPFSATPQPPTRTEVSDESPGSGPAGASDNPSVANPAVGEGPLVFRPATVEPSAASNPGSGPATEPGVEPSVSNDPIRTWANTPGVDPGEVNDMKGTRSPVPTDEAPSERPSDAPQAPEDDLRELTRGNAEFAFDLYRELSVSDGNLFFSPHSISSALAMTYGGARGGTEAAMAAALRFPLPQERLHPAFDALSRNLSDRSDGEENGKFRLNAANAVWAQDSHPFRETYLGLVKNSYGAEVGLADFTGNPEGSRAEINRWVAGRTEDRIEDLIPPGLIDGLTRMVLVNAVYFKAGWFHPFDKYATTREPFRLLDGGTASVEMMRATEYFGYGAGEGYQVVDLPYVGGELSMTVLLPDWGRFEEFEKRLDTGYVGGLLADVAETYVALEMPRFEFDAAFRLAETLKTMGMPGAFDPAAADFSGMDGLSCARGDDGCPYIADVVHKGFVSVDEAGTEAAAATGVVMQTESAKPRPVAVRVDRPFIFLIRDRPTGAVLFLGRVMEP